MFLNGNERDRTTDYGQEIAHQVSTAVKRLLDEAFNRSLLILRANRELLEEMAASLLLQETLDEAQLNEYRKRIKPA